MPKRALYLEERIAIVREALNKRTVGFGRTMDERERVHFQQFVLELMNVLDGFESCAHDWVEIRDSEPPHRHYHCSLCGET